MTDFSKRFDSEKDRDELLARAFSENTPQTAADNSPAVERDNDEELTVGELELAERNAFRRVTHRTEIRHADAEDVYEVEYRKLRLEQVILVGVWTEGTIAEVEAAMAELADLTETAGAEIVGMLYQKREKHDAGTFIGSGKVKELKGIIDSTGADTVICDGELTPGQLNALDRKSVV